MKYLIIIASSLLASSAQAFYDYYDCIEIGGSSISWNGIYKKYKKNVYIKPDKPDKPDKPSRVKLTDINTKTPYLSGHSTSKLTRASSNTSTLWLLEFTPGGTVVTWTLFSKNIELGSPKTLLISSKSYSLAGAANFTTIYECEQ